MKIPSRKLTAARLFTASRSDPRAYLYGVLFDYDGDRIVASNSRGFCVIPHTFGANKPTGRALYLLPRGGLGYYCELTDGTLTTYNRRGEEQECYRLFTQDASKYPYFDRLLPTDGDVPQSGQIYLNNSNWRLISRVLPANCTLKVTVYKSDTIHDGVVEVRANDNDNYEELRGIRLLLGPSVWERKEL